MKWLYLSKLTNPIPFVALRVSIIPKGAKSNVASHPPKVAEMELSSAMFFPKELMKKYPNLDLLERKEKENKDISNILFII